MKIAIDVGGVLTQYENSESKDNQIINVNGAIDVLTKWKEQEHTLFILSYCKRKSAEFRTQKLKEDGHSVLFNFEYYTANKYQKYEIINWITADIMIDDNEQILNNIKQYNPNVITILFQEFNEVEKRSHKKHLLANNWKEVEELVSKIILNPNKPVEYRDLPPDCVINNIHENALFIEKN
jgi:hypothetical protein